MFYICSFHFSMIVFLFYREAVLRKCSLKSVLKNFAKLTRKHMYQILFLSATSNFIDEETRGRCFPTPLTIFVNYVRLGSKYSSVLPHS